MLSLFALHCGIFALLVPWHVGEGASADLGNVIRVVCCDDESILHYDPIVALSLVESEGNLFFPLGFFVSCFAAFSVSGSVL
jgi:hypothetical protein